jgi:hypothetical protein
MVHNRMIFFFIFIYISLFLLNSNAVTWVNIHLYVSMPSANGTVL